MTSSTLPHPESLAELLDARPDTREMISANRSLAEACLLLKGGEHDSLEHILAQAKSTPSPGIETISACIRAEATRLSGRVAEAWDMAENIVSKNRFDIVAALYLRFLFPYHKETASIQAPILPPPAPPSEAVAPQAPEPEPSVASSSVPTENPPASAASQAASAIDSPLHSEPDAPSQTFHDPDSEVSLAIEHEPSEDAIPVMQGSFPSALAKIAQDESVRLLRLRSPDGTIAEMNRSTSTILDLDEQLLERPAGILASLGFGRLQHACIEGAEGIAHSWQRSGKALFLVADNSTSAPALAARCSHAMEEQQ